jgi:hypothetical protein
VFEIPASVGRRVARRARQEKRKPSELAIEALQRYIDLPRFLEETPTPAELRAIRFERAVAEGASVVSIHRAEADKVAGGRVAVRVFALFVIEEGKIVLCDELTRLEQGAAEDRDLASRVPT